MSRSTKNKPDLGAFAEDLRKFLCDWFPGYYTTAEMASHLPVNRITLDRYLKADPKRCPKLNTLANIVRALDKFKLNMSIDLSQYREARVSLEAAQDRWLAQLGYGTGDE